MAEFNGYERKLQQKTTSKLPDDVILEIVAGLPLKYILQCSILNKNIRRGIFQPNFLPSYPTIFHCSSSEPKIYTTICREIRSNSTIVHRPRRKSVILDTLVTINASCNGLLLLSLNGHSYIFNPTTGGIMAVDGRGFDNYTGLAVPEDSRVKLVAVEVRSTILEFTVFAPSPLGSGESVAVKTCARFDFRRKFKLMEDVRPVYAHGSLYWLGSDGREMVAFDVEKEEARLIEGPVRGDELTRVYLWFGFADGAIHLVYALPSEIVICRHDHVEGGWRVKCRVANVCNPTNNDYRNGIPVFFDGRRLLFVLRKSGVGGGLYSYSLVRNLWEGIQCLDSWLDAKQSFFSYTPSFTPSFVKMSDTYLDRDNTKVWRHESGRNSLLRLRQLLLVEEK